MKIGLFGGTFDPPHIGHTELAYDFYRSSNPDLLIVMPSFIPPHKANYGTSPSARFEMTKLAFLPLGELGVNYIVSDYEISKADTSYTIDTVNYLLKRYCVEKIDLCVGSDMLFYFEKWKSAEQLMQKCVIYTKERFQNEHTSLCDYADYLTEKYGAEIHIMPGQVVEISSTELRNDSRCALISPAVSEYMKKNGLYEK